MVKIPIGASVEQRWYRPLMAIVCGMMEGGQILRVSGIAVRASI